jgi:DNA-binding transcriptional ArsR family regulator
MTVETPETLSKKRKKVREINKFLPEETRIELMEQLEKVGINPTEMSDGEMIKAVAKVANDEVEKNIRYNADKTVMGLNSYSVDTHLRDKELIKRLFMLNVPQIYLPAFEDSDMKLTDREIWEVVQKSGIVQISDPKEINQERTHRRIITQ